MSVKKKKCEFIGCILQSSFSFEGQMEAKLCSEHKLEGMVEVLSLRVECKAVGCRNKPCFNFFGQKQPKVCLEHKIDGMIDFSQVSKQPHDSSEEIEKLIVHVRSKCEGCSRLSTHNFKGLPPKFCFQHKQDGMVKLHGGSHQCQMEGCYKTPVFNFRGAGRGLYCAAHRKSGMVNTQVKTCEANNCFKSCHFNFKGKKQPRFCSHHKLKDMVNISMKGCEVEGCPVQPSYNFEFGAGCRRCSSHRLPGMINCKRRPWPKQNERNPEKCKENTSYNNRSGIQRRAIKEIVKEENMETEERRMLNKRLKQQFTRLKKRLKQKQMRNGDCSIDYVAKKKPQPRPPGRFGIASGRTVRLCDAPDCEKQPTYNFKGESARFCAKHREFGMVDVKSKRCEADGCNKRPSYNYKGMKGVRFCFMHLLPGMIHTKGRRCTHPSCDKRAGFNEEGEDIPIFCSSHKSATMVDMYRNKICNVDNCSRRARYNMDGLSEVLLCLHHKEPGMVDVTGKKCDFDGCCRMSKFCFDKHGPKYCETHKEDGMVPFVRHKTCEFSGCLKVPCYNYAGSKTARFCQDHMLEKMVNVKREWCRSPGCERRPVYNYANAPGVRFCQEHRLKDMVSKARRNCEYPKCQKMGSFNFEGERQGRFCKEHSLPGMVNVVSRRCGVSRCARQAIFNYPNETQAVLCGSHQLPGMVRWTLSKCSHKCSHSDCLSKPSFGFREKDERFCELHKLPEMEYLPGSRGRAKSVATKEEFTTAKICENDGCIKRAEFNFNGAGEPKLCRKHKSFGMINVLGLQCSSMGCIKPGVFRLADEKHPRKYCQDHKSEEMIKNPTLCNVHDCTTRARYNHAGSKRPEFCSTHKQLNMVDLCRALCMEPNCFTRPRFNFPNISMPIFCQSHKKEGMVRVSQRGCEYPDCLKPSSFNFENEKLAIYCKQHRHRGMINVVMRRKVLSAESHDGACIQSIDL